MSALHQHTKSTILVCSNQHVEGNRNNVVGSRSVVIGNDNTVTGSNAKVTGNGNLVTGSSSQIRGNNNRVIGSNCQVWGEGNIVEGGGCTLNGEPVPCEQMSEEFLIDDGNGRIIIKNMVIGKEGVKRVRINQLAQETKDENE
jgi:hypothetical protein